MALLSDKRNLLFAARVLGVTAVDAAGVAGDRVLAVTLPLGKVSIRGELWLLSELTQYHMATY